MVYGRDGVEIEDNYYWKSMVLVFWSAVLNSKGSSDYFDESVTIEQRVDSYIIWVSWNGGIMVADF